MEEYSDKVDQLINRGRFMEASKLAAEGLNNNPDDTRLLQLRALALSKSGTPEEAARILEPLYQREPDNPETAGIMGGIYKNIFMKAQDPDYGMKSYETYLKNYQSTGNYYTGINAATMSALIGMAGRGRKIADEILPKLDENDFWELATRAEALLLKKDYDAAIADYVEVRKVAKNNWGKINSIRSQLWLLSHYVRVPSAIKDIFHPPTVAAFIGHMIDQPDRNGARFPEEIENDVYDGILGLIRTLDVNIGYCSLACGSDILFAEAMIQEGRELAIFLPFHSDDFIETSVSFAGGNWVERYHKILESNHPIYVTRGRNPGNDEVFQYLGKAILGASVIRAQLNTSTPYLISVLSNYDMENKPGGTRDMIQFWPYPENHRKLDIDAIRRRKFDDSPGTSIQSSSRTQESILRNTIMVRLDKCSDEDVNQILERLDAIKSDLINPFQHYSYGDERIILAHSSVNQLLEIAESIKHSSENPVWVIFHTILTTDGELSLDNPHMSFLDKLYDPDSTESSFVSTGHFAAQVALENSSYAFNYGGIIRNPNENELFIFRLTRK